MIPRTKVKIKLLSFNIRVTQFKVNINVVNIGYHQLAAHLLMHAM